VIVKGDGFDNPRGVTLSKQHDDPMLDFTHCPRCNYPLRGLTRPVCPECGGAFDPTSLVRRTRAYGVFKPIRSGEILRRAMIAAIVGAAPWVLVIVWNSYSSRGSGFGGLGGATVALLVLFSLCFLVFLITQSSESALRLTRPWEHAGSRRAWRVIAIAVGALLTFAQLIVVVTVIEIARQIW